MASSATVSTPGPRGQGRGPLPLEGSARCPLRAAGAEPQQSFGKSFTSSFGAVDSPTYHDKKLCLMFKVTMKLLLLV